MTMRPAILLLCAAALLAPMLGIAAAPPPRNFFVELKPLQGDLVRYQYLHRLMPQLAPDERMQARQFLAFADANLGLYRAAARDFPFPGWARKWLVIPTPAQWQAVDAADAIVRLATDRRIVLINEAHHDPHTRLLTLALLPRLRALGFTHFAAEALDEKDTG